MSAPVHPFESLGLSITQRLGTAAGGRVLLVTSARAAEGKSFVAHRLAAALAGTLGGTPEGDAGRRVALVDANAANPALDAAFAASPGADFFAGLGGAALPAERLQATSVAGLFALPAVRTAPTADTNAALLFRADAIARVLGGLRAAFGLTILDAGPLPEVGALALQADATLVVVDASRTRRDVVAGALDSPHVDRHKVLGVVLNRRPEPVPRWLYRSVL